MSQTFAGRVRVTDQGPGFSDCVLEFPLSYADGYEIAVWWEAEDEGEHAPGYWCARLTGTRAQDGPLGTGDSQINALFDLCCSLAALADALTPDGDT